MSELKFFEKLDQIDDLINSVDELGYDHAFISVATYLDNPYICQYFFEKINHEKWADIVIDSEFVRKYRSGKITSLDNNQFDWFFMSYLLKVADKIPDQVSSYLKSIVTTEDERLRERMIEVMIRLPCKISADLAQNEVKWCKTKEFLYRLYPNFAGKLILHIQECNEEVAFDLIKELSEVKAVIREIGEPGSDNYHKSVDVKVKFSDWEYQTLLSKYISKFILRCNQYQPVLTYMCGVMSNILDLEKSNAKDDYSWIWRNTLEDNEQTRHISGIKEHQLIWLRDVSISLIKDDPSRFGDIVQIISGFKWTIFRRLSIYLSVKFPEVDIKLTNSLVSDTSLYDDHRTQNEYSLLLDSAFNIVDDNVRKSVYDWIEGGPNIDDFKLSVIEHEGREPTKDEVDSRIKYWQKNRLYLIKKYLDEDWLNYYNSLIETTGGEPEHPEYSSYVTSWVGPTSPKSVDEINSLSISELVSYLKEWEPSGESMESSREGLSRNLAEAIKINIDNYKHCASSFIGLSPTYIRGMIQGFRDSIAKLDNKSWSEIIDLSKWVLSQEYDIEAESDVDLDEDPGWSWCRKSIASLLGAGLKKGEGHIPLLLKDRVWDLILVLTQDPDPTPTHEEEYGGSNMEPTTLAINTVRGEAMHALVEYGLWVARNTEDKKISFVDLPEMKEVLEVHLIPEKDPSLAIRSVYGQFFPWLSLLDANWVNEAKSRIFSDDELGLGDAAWDAYITFCQPYDETLKVIADIYKKYAKRLSDYKESDDRDRSLENIGSHLITFYWRSKLELDDEVLQTFYKYAPLTLRKYAIEFIGRSLGNTPVGLEDNIEKRLKELYEWRQAVANKTTEYEELEGFCWWIDADVMDREWALNKFYELLQVQDKLDALDFAARKLANYFDVDPAKVLECLSMMLEKLKIPGMYFTWDDSAQEILKEALSNDDVKEQAIALVHKFGSKGFLNYRDLLCAQ